MREIRKSTTADIDAIMDLFDAARLFMAANGNPGQWGDGYPTRAHIENDIMVGTGHVCVEDGEIVGTFYFGPGPDPTYAVIENGSWLDDTPYGVVHRIATKTGTRGVASFCMDWCQRQCGNVRIDTHHDNTPMRNLMRKLGFTECGIIYLENGDPRIAFQKKD